MILNNIDNAMLGTDQVDKIYLGADEIWTATHNPDGSDDINYGTPLTMVFLRDMGQFGIRYYENPNNTGVTNYMKSIHYRVTYRATVVGEYEGDITSASTVGGGGQPDTNSNSPVCGYTKVDYYLSRTGSTGMQQSFKAGDKIEFWGTGDGSWANVQGMANFINAFISGTNSLENGGIIFWYGNINSLLCSKSEFEQNHNGNAGEYSFYGLFRMKTGQTFNDEYITSAATIDLIGGKTGKHILLPEPLNGVQDHMYAYMFWGTNLLGDLTLPTVKVPVESSQGMSSITAYDHLFFFDYSDSYDTSSLNPTPRLNKIKCMANGHLIYAPNWLRGTNSFRPQSTGTFIQNQYAYWTNPDGVSGIPSGWTVQDA